MERHGAVIQPYVVCGLAGVTGGVGGEVLLPQVQQRQDGLLDGVGHAAPGRVLDGLGQAADLVDDALAGAVRRRAFASAPAGTRVARDLSLGRLLAVSPAASSSNSSRMTSTPMRHGPQRPHDSSWMSLR